MSRNEQKEMQRKMTGRKFIGIWMLAGQIFGMAFSDRTYGFTSEIIAYQLGAGIPFALIGATLGAIIIYFFRKGKQ